MDEKPLFIPLKREFFQAFKAGEKVEEYRPEGPENDRYLLALASRAGVVVAAWGANGTHLGRSSEVLKLLPKLQCLSLTKDGHPGHPLYLRKTLTPIPMCNDLTPGD